MGIDLRVGPFVWRSLREDPREAWSVARRDRLAAIIRAYCVENLGLEYDPGSVEETTENVYFHIGPAAHVHRFRDLACQLEGFLSQDEACESADCHFQHLINHEDGLGFYLPIEFDDPFWIVCSGGRTEIHRFSPPWPEPSSSFLQDVLALLPFGRPRQTPPPDDVVSVGSSVRLLDEVLRLKYGVGEDHPWLGERFASLVEAATLSAEKGLILEMG